MANFITKAKSPVDPWTRLLQATVRDKNLSFRARGVLFRLLSNVDGYRMAVSDLVKEGMEGRDAIGKAVKELREARYILMIRLKDEKGQFKGTESYIFHEPQTQLEDELKEEVKKVKVSSVKKGSPNAPIGKTFGNFGCEFVDGRFVIGAALLAKLKKNYPAVAAEKEKYIGVEGYLLCAGIAFKLSEGRNQVAKGEWKLSRWLAWYFEEEQTFITNLELFGKKNALDAKFGMLRDQKQR